VMMWAWAPEAIGLSLAVRLEGSRSLSERVGDWGRFHEYYQTCWGGCRQVPRGPQGQLELTVEIDHENGHLATASIFIIVILTTVVTYSVDPKVASNLGVD